MCCDSIGSLLNPGIMTYILFMCEHRDAEYVCWRFREVWKFSTFPEVASFKNLKSFSILFLNS